MGTFLQRRPSASMVVALIALVVAMSGSAVAASRLIRGDSLIRKGSLSGNRLRRHTITGTQINLRKLGTVPKARSAGHAGSAGYAVNATNATNAQNASHASTADNAAHASSADNASALGGQPASSFLTTGDRVGTNGIVKVAGTPSGATVTLFTQGPFTVSMTCTRSGTDTSLDVYAASSESGSDLDGYTNAPANTLEDVESLPAGPNPNSYNPFPLTLEAPSGAYVVVNGGVGMNELGPAGTCWANFAGIS